MGTVYVCREADTRDCHHGALFLGTERTSQAERTQVTCPCADFAASRDTSPCASEPELRPHVPRDGQNEI